MVTKVIFLIELMVTLRTREKTFQAYGFLKFYLSVVDIFLHPSTLAVVVVIIVSLMKFEGGS